MQQPTQLRSDSTIAVEIRAASFNALDSLCKGPVITHAALFVHHGAQIRRKSTIVVALTSGCNQVLRDIDLFVPGEAGGKLVAVAHFALTTAGGSSVRSSTQL